MYSILRQEMTGYKNSNEFWTPYTLDFSKKQPFGHKRFRLFIPSGSDDL